MNFYRTFIESDLHRQVERYMSEAEKVEKSADELAKRMGATVYKPSFFSDFGGISVLGYTGKVPLHSLRKVDEEDGFKYYEPIVKVTEYVKDSKFLRGLDRMQKVNRWFDVREINLNEARSLTTYSEALSLARIVKSGSTIADLSDKYRISPVWITLYYEGKISFATLCSKSHGSILKYSEKKTFTQLLSGAMCMEEQLVEKLGSMKLYHIRKVEGPRNAVALYRDLQSLPQIPSGRLVELLGLTFDSGEMSLPAFFKSGGSWYFKTSGHTDKEGLEKISFADFQDTASNINHGNI